MGNEVDSLREEIKELKERIVNLEQAFEIMIEASTILAKDLYLK